MIEVELEDLGALQRIEQLLSRIERPRPVLIQIGEIMVESTKERFPDGVDPDGAPWEPNSPVTIAIYGGLFASAGAKKPLVGETHRLSGEISWQLEGDRAVAIGSPLPYAAMQQHGGTTSPRSMIPGVEIPARPFLGLSDSDERQILDFAYKYFIATRSPR